MLVKIQALMDSLQGPIYSYLLGEHLDVEFLAFDEQEDFEEKIPFLQMLQSVEQEPPCEPNFQTLLKLQHLKKPWEIQIQAFEPESCVTHEILPPEQPQCSSVKSETELVKQTIPESPVVGRRKRKRTRPIKNKEEVESQRMTHIAVERNRRRQMNDHLTALRSLMPPSYVLRGDQASIIGGAIDFVKELEQLLQSLEAQKNSSENGFFSPAPEYENSEMEEFTTEKKTDTAEIGVTVIQSHVNLKIQCPKKTGQLLKTIVALEELKFTILHLNITSSQSSVLYTFNLKIEDECKLGTSEEIAGAVHEVFSLMNGG